LILVNPAVGGRDDHALRFLHRLVQNLGPAVHNLLLVDRARREAVTIERARVARQIHDNSLQALASIELQMQALEREALFEPDLAARAGRLRGLLHEEALNLRDLMHALQPGDVRPDDLPGALADLVERHERETGMAAVFVSDGTAIDLPPATCREIAGLVREALVNVRKHSAARHVTVRLERSTESWALTIEDDGKGLDFTGELSIDELDERRKGPRVIKERVRALGARMTLASTPGKRSCLRIVIPAS
jgi:two-component system nitrate/nitrite sensor histidine kinase NarX